MKNIFSTLGESLFLGNIKLLGPIFILVINQLDAQTVCFTKSLFHASTCFEHHVLIIRRSKLHYTASGIITLLNSPLPAIPSIKSLPTIVGSDLIEGIGGNGELRSVMIPEAV